ncbi:MAG: prephenate dehydratase, partial [Gammaproteobacteria bacterium]|nr:prephenate dehydratase [Gammaproteobacteria bacterium]
PLEREGISLTRIETRPSRTENWAYVFFMEFHGHHSDAKVQRVIEQFKQQASFVKVLGSYPAAVF